MCSSTSRSGHSPSRGTRSRSSSRRPASAPVRSRYAWWYWPRMRWACDGVAGRIAARRTARSRSSCCAMRSANRRPSSSYSCHTHGRPISASGRSTVARTSRSTASVTVGIRARRPERPRPSPTRQDRRPCAGDRSLSTRGSGGPRWFPRARSSPGTPPPCASRGRRPRRR